MNRYLSLCLFLSAVFLSGCKEKTYDDSYYAENPKKAKEILIECKNGNVSNENCMNAKKGIGKIMANLLDAQLKGKPKPYDDDFIKMYEEARAVRDNK